VCSSDLQPAASLDRLTAQLDRFDAFELAAVHDLVALSGSLVIGLAAAAARDAPETLWDLSRLDETYQAELWGTDDEAAEIAAQKRRDFLQAMRFLALARGTAA
jgi:chaperone required for assembly of F1-ATPase